MCGIVGVIPRLKNGFNFSQQKMFYQLLLADEMRGMDATGVITVHSNGDFGIMKEASAAYYFHDQFVDSDLDKDLYKNGVAAIGHNRAKTVGENKDANAHPFSVDKTFAMVHNGTLRNHLELEKDVGKTDVDSEALAILFKRAMDEEDWKTALEEAIGKVKGAYACVWYDQKRHQVCMIRNTERPLGFIETKTEILFGSELAMLSWIANRNGSSVEKWKSLETHKLYTFDMKEGGGAFGETFLSPKYQFQKGYTNGTKKTSTANGQGMDGDTETTSTDSDPVGACGALSKNGFKKLRATIFRKEIEFLQEDYVESSSGTFLVMGRSINGAFDLCEVRHNISGLLDGKKQGVEEKDFWVDGMLFKGIVADAVYDRDNSAITITLENLSLKGYQSEKVVH